MKHTPWILAIALAFAFIVRVVIPWQSTFNGGVLLNTPDAYIMLHYADLWPNFPSWDWYTNYPQGAAIPSTVLTFASVIAIVGRVFHMSSWLVGAFLPVVLFYLTLLPVYLTARTLFDKTVALGSVVIFCLLPGELLQRTMLGAADYHCWEIFLFSSTMMFIILALKKHYMYWLGAIELMVIYWVSWAGALLIPFILVAGIGLFAFLRLKKWHWKGLLVLCYAGSVLACYLALPKLFAIGKSMFLWNLKQVNLELMPLFFSQGQFNIDTMWAYFGPVFFFALFGLGWFAYITIRYKRIEDAVFLVWSVIGLFMMLAMRRFAYYWAFNASLLAVFACVGYVTLYAKDKEKLATNVIALVLLVCVIPMSISIQSSLKSQFAMSKDWQATVQWLRSQSNDEVYYSGQKPGNGVFTWWSYGYWIIAEGHQSTLDTPGYIADNRTGKLLLSKDIQDSVNRLKVLGMKYIVIDKNMVDDSIYAIAEDSGLLRDATFQELDTPKSFMVRLYNGHISGIDQVQQFGDVKVFIIR
jgi:asparagine N-glycosylation enzyme membrane subunit Stt3